MHYDGKWSNRATRESLLKQDDDHTRDWTWDQPDLYWYSNHWAYTGEILHIHQLKDGVRTYQVTRAIASLSLLLVSVALAPPLPTFAFTLLMETHLPVNRGKNLRWIICPMCWNMVHCPCPSSVTTYDGKCAHCCFYQTLNGGIVSPTSSPDS